MGSKQYNSMLVRLGVPGRSQFLGDRWRPTKPPTGVAGIGGGAGGGGIGTHLPTLVASAA